MPDVGQRAGGRDHHDQPSHEGPTRSDLTRLMAHPEYIGRHVPVPLAALSELMGSVQQAVGCTARSGAVITDIGAYGLADPAFAVTNAIAIDLSDEADIHGVVCEAMPRAQVPPTLHLFDGDGHCLHRMHATSAEECRLVMGFTGKASPDGGEWPFHVHPSRDHNKGQWLGTLSQHNLFDLLDFCQHLRLPLIKWVGSATCIQHHYGAIDNLWWRSGCFRLKANSCTLSADLSFAASLRVIELGPDNLQLTLSDEAGRSFAGFGHSASHDHRVRATWSNLLKGLCRPGLD